MVQPTGGAVLTAGSACVVGWSGSPTLGNVSVGLQAANGSLVVIAGQAATRPNASGVSNVVWIVPAGLATNGSLVVRELGQALVTGSQAVTVVAARVCAVGAEYETVAPSCLVNRQCASITVCSAAQFRTLASTTTSDAQCSPVTNCTSQQYQAVPATATSDAACRSISSCGPSPLNAFQAAAATATSDVVCTNTTACTALQYEATAPTPTADRTCVSLTVCVGDTYASRNSTATSDRACDACPPGFAGGNGLVCTDINECLGPNNGGCSRYADCTNTIGSRSCTCWSDVGFVGNGTLCQRPCDVHPCVHGNCTNQGIRFSCQCDRDYSGDTCSTYGECKILF